MSTQTAFGGMLQHLVEFTSIILCPEPLDKEIERRCKQAWEQALCPECGETAIQSGDASPRIWCTNCRYVFSYTRNTPFEGRTLTPGEIVIAFVLYADTLLSIHQIAQLFEAVYDTIHTTIREGEAAFERGFFLVWERIHTLSTARPRSTKQGRSAPGSKARRRRGTGFPAAARGSEAEHAGKERPATP